MGSYSHFSTVSHNKYKSIFLEENAVVTRFPKTDSDQRSRTSPAVSQKTPFAEVVSKKTKPKVNGNDGLTSLKIFAAINKSAKTGKKVKL